VFETLIESAVDGILLLAIHQATLINNIDPCYDWTFSGFGADQDL